MKFVFDQIIIDRQRNSIYAISDKDDIRINCKLTTKKLKYIMKHIDDSTKIIDNSNDYVHDNNGDNIYDQPNIHIVQTDDVSQLFILLKDEIMRILNEYKGKDGESIC